MANKPAVFSDPPLKSSAQRAAPTGMTPDVMAEMLLDFLKRRGISAILLGLAAGALASYGAYLLLPVTYKAVAKVQIVAPEGDIRPEVFKATQIERMKSDKVLNDALSLPEAQALDFVQRNPAHLDVLRGWLKCESQPDSQIVDITLTGVDPVEIKHLVNAVMKAYIAQASSSMNEQTRLEIANYQKEKERLEKQIAEYKNRQKEIALKAEQSDPESLRSDLQEQQKAANEINAKITEITLAIPKVEDELKRIRTTEPPIPAAELAVVLNDQQLSQMQKELQNQLRLAKDQLSATNLGTDDPEYQALSRKAAETEARIAKRREQILAPFREQAKRAREIQCSKLEDDLKHLREEQAFFETKKFPLDRRIGELKKAANEIDGFRSKILADEESLKDIAKKLQQLSLQSDAKHITIVDEAQVPRLPSSSTKRLAMIGGAGIGSFGLILAIFWLLDFRLKLISRPEHVQRLLSVPVIGILPKIPGDKRLATDADFTGPRRVQRMWNAMHEAINSLRITLMFAPDRRGVGLTSLMVTSPRDGEGKSTLTANLAVSLARSGVRVVVIEADMHRPTLSATFGVAREPGLSDYLRGEKSAGEVIRQTDYPNLDAVPAGTECQGVDTLLNSDRLNRLFDDLRRRGYQTMLVDAPPVLPVCDALLLGQHVEQTVLCALCNHSQFYSLRQAQDRLEKIGIHVLGVVVAGAPVTQKYGYYEYQGYASSTGTIIPPRIAPPPSGAPSETNGVDSHAGLNGSHEKDAGGRSVSGPVSGPLTAGAAEPGA